MNKKYASLPHDNLNVTHCEERCEQDQPPNILLKNSEKKMVGEREIIASYCLNPTLKNNFDQDEFISTTYHRITAVSGRTSITSLGINTPNLYSINTVQTVKQCSFEVLSEQRLDKYENFNTHILCFRLRKKS